MHARTRKLVEDGSQSGTAQVVFRSLPASHFTANMAMHLTIRLTTILRFHILRKFTPTASSTTTTPPPTAAAAAAAAAIAQDFAAAAAGPEDDGAASVHLRVCE